MHNASHVNHLERLAPNVAMGNLCGEPPRAHEGIYIAIDLGLLLVSTFAQEQQAPHTSRIETTSSVPQ